MTGTTGVPGDATDAADDLGTLYVVGIGPGLPHAMTQRARDVIRHADCVIASNLYQEFLRRDGTIPPESRTEPIEEQAASNEEAASDGAPASNGAPASDGGVAAEATETAEAAETAEAT